MRKRRGWSDFDNDEKLEALRNYVNRALDLAEESDKSLKQLRADVGRLSAIVFQAAKKQKPSVCSNGLPPRLILNPLG